MYTPTDIEKIFFKEQESSSGDSQEGNAAFDSYTAELQRIKPDITIAEQNDLFDCVADYGAINRREGFVEGFKYAIRLMNEVYRTDR